MDSTLQLSGVGLRAPHYTEFMSKRPAVAWIEVHSENYFGEGGKGLTVLENLRKDYPISLHGVSLSIGSTDELNWQHLKKLRDLSTRIQPCLVSDHLSWSSVGGHYFHDLLPLPFTEEAIAHTVLRIQQVQDYLNRQILIENVSSYVCYAESSLSEPEFLKEVATRSGCGILLDINNIYVNATNLHFSPSAYLSSLPAELIQEFHVAGFTTTTIQDKDVLIDTHNRPVVPAVWELYREAINYFGRKPTIMEWDADLPSLSTLCLEAYRAEKIMRETYVTTCLPD